MSGSAPGFVPTLPAYAAELAKGRRRGLRPETRAELDGRDPEGWGGLDNEVAVVVTDSWDLAKHQRSRGRAAVVIEPGPLYDFKWARGWNVIAITREPFVGLRGWIAEQGAAFVRHYHDPDRVKALEARARA